MDDININNIYLHIEEANVDEEDWIKLNWINKESDNNENSQSSEIQKDLDDKIPTIQIKNDENEVLCTNADSEDVSDDISVITESDTDAFNTSFYEVHRPNCSIYDRIKIAERQVNIQTVVINIIIACAVGIIIGLALNRPPIVPETCSISSGIDIQSFKTESRNIVENCKELVGVKDMLNEIKAHILSNNEVSIKHIWQVFDNINNSKKIGNKPVMKPLNSGVHLLDQLEISLHVLSALAGEIYDNNISLKNEMNKTLVILNDTKMFYENLLFDDNIQNINPDAMRFLQDVSHNIHHASQLLLYDLAEKVNKITLNVYNKFNKIKHKLNKKFCNLRNTLLDTNKFLKRLTEHCQLIKDYEKSCYLNSKPSKINSKITTESNSKINRKPKKQAKKDSYDDSLLYMAYDNNDIWKVDKLVNHDNKDNDYLSKEEIQKLNILKINFDDISSQSDNKYSGSKLTDACVNANVPSLKSKCDNYIINNKYNNDKNEHTNMTKTISKHSEEISVAKEESGAKQKKYIKPDNIVKKILNDKNADIKENNIFSSKEQKDSENNKKYRKCKKVKENNRRINADWQFERSQAREEQRQPDISDWYFHRAHYRKHARKFAEYQQDTKFRK